MIGLWGKTLTGEEGCWCVSGRKNGENGEK